jgi:hypothetical protein
MEVLKNNANGIELHLDKVEYGIVYTCLREVVGCFERENFATKIGVPEDVTEGMMNTMRAVIRKQLKDRGELE